MAQPNGSTGSFLNGVRVLELADELGEYAGKLLAGLGADVIKVEPPGGEITRTYGPFYKDTPHPNRSLYFWHFNFGKRGIALDLDTEADRAAFIELARSADVVIDTRHRTYLTERDIGYDALHAANPRLVYARISPFGDDGPWADYAASDLVHLALGGVMMNCGYDAMPDGSYELPPVAPQMWQAYAITGEMAVIGIMGALSYALQTGHGQALSTAVHDAVSKNTEVDTPEWMFQRGTLYRQTGRHALPRDLGNQMSSASSSIAMTKDGRWVLPYRTYLPNDSSHGSVPNLVALLREYGIDDIADEKYDDAEYIQRPEVVAHVDGIIAHLIAAYRFDRDLWREGQEAGFAWAPLRRPEENAEDAHWLGRETFVDVEFPELGETFRDVRAKWVAPGLPWRTSPRAPLMGEHTAAILAEPPHVPNAPSPSVVRPESIISKRGKPFALAGVRVIDLSWMLASGGAARFLAAQGAEVIKVEHRSKIDMMRNGRVGPKPGGRAERDAATGPLPRPGPHGSLNRSGGFYEANPGKRAISLNLKDPKGKQILRDLIVDADLIIEGYSPGTLARMGFSYDELRAINPSIIYVSQSGLGQQGVYGRHRSFGPPAQAFSGLTEMSGMPEPFPPAGIGYSYLDWWGAYQMAVAMFAGLYRKQVTGEGCWIDSSQVESGIYITGTAVLDHSANGRRWHRHGNRSPYKAAAPSGAYRTIGEDRWIAISAFTEEQWLSLTRVLGVPGLANDPKLATLELRLAHQDYLDPLIDRATQAFEPFALMEALQAAGVPAGVCQSAEDRYENDPQLHHLEWLVDLNQTECGVWPAKELPVKFSETPSYIGSIIDRHAPNYGEDNEYVYGEILGLTKAEIDELDEAGVL